MHWIRFVAIVFIVGLITFPLHEFGHWLAGEIVGHDMQMKLNSAGPADPDAEVSNGQLLVVKAGGPLVTLLQAVLGALLARRLPLLGFALVFTALHMRFMAFAVTILAHPNDEGRIGELLGIGPFPVHIAVLAVLTALAVYASIRARIGWLGWVLAFIASSASVSLIVYIEPVVGRLI